MADEPRISFGMIVLNGMPFVVPCLKAVYGVAHELLVVEGAVKSASPQATPDGHSVDGTLEALRDFPDPDGKLKLFTRDGFWSEKDEMCNEYIHHCTGDYIWQIDCDEFYQPQDIRTIADMLRDDPTITSVSFVARSFFGGFDTLAVGGRRDEPVQRIKKYYPGAHYLTHRTPTVLTLDGRRMRDINEVHAYDLERRGIYLYHYGYVLPMQAQRKTDYYDTGAAGPTGNDDLSDWTATVLGRLDRPLQTDIDPRKPSWLERFTSEHPPEIRMLTQRLQNGVERIGGEPIVLRPQEDLPALLDDPAYRRAVQRARRLNVLYRAHVLMVEMTGSAGTPAAWRRARRSAAMIWRSLCAGNVLGAAMLAVWWCFMLCLAAFYAFFRRIRIGGAISVLAKKWIAHRTSRLARSCKMGTPKDRQV